VSENRKVARCDTVGEELILKLIADGELSIDEDGRIWRHRIRRGRRVDVCAPRRAEHPTPKGYLQIRAMVAGHRHHVSAHRVVYRYFYGDIPDGLDINHDNGQKADNRPKNLLPESISGNAKHAHRNGLIDQYGQKNPAVKLSDKAVAEIRLAYSKGGFTQATLAQQYGVAHQTVSKLVRGQRRPKQLGPVSDREHRYAPAKDKSTGRFTGARAAGHELDGATHDGFPGMQS
jgi:DNA-binding XRE family transcriptional regulator